MLAEIRTHRGVRYLYVDYQGAKTNEELLGLLESGLGLQKENPDVTRVLVVFIGATITPQYMQRLKEVGQNVNYKTALVGIVGVEKEKVFSIGDATKFDTHLFPTEAEALEWVVE